MTSSDQTLNVAGIPAEEFMGMHVFRAMAAHAHAFLTVARDLAVEASTAPPLAIERPMASVILSVAGLDAFLNEDVAIVEASGSFLDECTKLHESRDPLDERWASFGTLLGLKLERGRRPFQTVKKMVDLRNVLVHRSARFRPIHAFPHPTVEALERTGEFAFASTLDGGNLAWEQKVLNPACARWAFNTSLDMIAEHTRLRGPSPFHPPFVDLGRIP